LKVLANGAIRLHAVKQSANASVARRRFVAARLESATPRPYGRPEPSECVETRNGTRAPSDGDGALEVRAEDAR